MKRSGRAMSARVGRRRPGPACCALVDHVVQRPVSLWTGCFLQPAMSASPAITAFGFSEPTPPERRGSACRARRGNHDPVVHADEQQRMNDARRGVARWIGRIRPRGWRSPPSAMAAKGHGGSYCCLFSRHSSSMQRGRSCVSSLRPAFLDPGQATPHQLHKRHEVQFQH